MKTHTPTGDLRVLYVEDEVLIALDIADMLADRGIGNVTLCHRADEARAALDGGDFDIAVLDVNLGIDTSHSVAERCRALGIPIVFCTGYNRSEEITSAFDAPVIAKPVDPDALVGAIGRVAPAGAFAR